MAEGGDAKPLARALAATAGRKVPGLSAAAVQEDRVVWAGASGLADLASRTPATPDTVYLRYRSAPQTGPHFLEHLGGGGAFFNMMRIYPEERLGVVVMGNASSYDREPIAHAALTLR